LFYEFNITDNKPYVNKKIEKIKILNNKL